MTSELRTVHLVEPFQARLRAFAFGPELDAMAKELLHLLDGLRRRRADVEDRVKLKALALIAEYLDGQSRSQEAAALLKLTVEDLLEGSLASGEDVRLKRQRVWCCLAYALTHLRAKRPREAGKVIVQMRAFMEQELVKQDFPCHGTMALLRYYEGLWHRNLGQMNAAARDFDEALEQARMRLEEKQRKYEGVDADRLRREVIYSRVMTARILGFGHGGIALGRGRYVEARGWMLAASQILSQLGQEVWRRGLEVYARSATVLVQELARERVATLRENSLRLEELAFWFAGRNLRNAFIAGAFAVVADVRARQTEGGVAGRVELKGLKKRIDHYLRVAYADAGPLSGSAALALMDCLLRGQEFARCQSELDRFEKVFQGEEEVMAEFRVLQAELWMETGRTEAARALLTGLVEQKVANRGSKARAWALLARCEKEAGRLVWAERAMVAAREALDAVQDGFARAHVEEIGASVETVTRVLMAMPYQGEVEDPLWCDLDHNLEMARLNVVAAVHARHPDYNVEKLAAVMGRGHSWLYALLARHRDLEWVGRIRDLS